MNCRDIIDIIEKFAPIELAYPWDNSGFLCGDMDKEVKRVYITLDVDKYTVDEAVKNNADMIISHHPIMFGGIKKIDFSAPDGYVIKRLVQNNIALYASHTPMDCAKYGINEVLAKKAGLKNIKVLEPNPDYEGCGLGRYGELEKTITLSEFAEMIKSALDVEFVRICGNPDTIINIAAVGGGACDDLIPQALAKGADVILTSDMKYHISKDAVESGICVIDAGHYGTERFVIDIFANLFKDCEIDIIRSTERDIFERI